MRTCKNGIIQASSTSVHYTYSGLAKFSAPTLSRSLSRVAETVFASALRRSRIPFMASDFCRYNNASENRPPQQVHKL
jgi:hypothetical protein